MMSSKTTDTKTKIFDEGESVAVITHDTARIELVVVECDLELMSFIGERIQWLYDEGFIEY